MVFHVCRYPSPLSLRRYHAQLFVGREHARLILSQVSFRRLLGGTFTVWLDVGLMFTGADVFS